MRLIVGLGNPESKYDNTRHNIGFMIIDHFALKNGYSFKTKNQFKGMIYQGQDFILLKPLTYMNLSGDAVRLVSSFYKIDSKDILVISDDFNLPFSKLRLREKGSAGGHNGLKSIINSLSTNEFNRLRYGLGDINNNAIDFVLSKFSKEEIKIIEDSYSKTDEIIKDFIDGKPYDLIMNMFNSNEQNN